MVIRVSCWHEMGHMLTARVAQYKLDTLGLDKEAFQWALDILAPLQDMAGEINYPFVECAGWPDKLKSLTTNQMNPWHFVDIPLIDPNFSSANPEIDRNNITMQLSSIFKTLAANPKERVGRGKAILGKSFMLRYAVHLLGDIQQPLHCTNKYSGSHPNGDMGGNLVNVVYNGKKIDLHSVWDMMFDSCPQLQSPLAAADWQTMNSVTEALFAAYGDSDALADSLSFSLLSDYQTISQESFKFSSQVYNQVQDGSTLSDAYIKAGQTLTLQRVHQGGLRLAAFIHKAYQAYQKALNSPEETLEQE